MSVTRDHIELMAPAGSYESLQAAIQGGADSVYLGVEKLNMRSRSSFNFTLENLDRIVSIAGKAGIKTYLTLNSVIYGDELNVVSNIIQESKKSGIDAPDRRPKILPSKKKAPCRKRKMNDRSELKILNTSPWMLKRRYYKWI